MIFLRLILKNFNNFWGPLVSLLQPPIWPPDPCVTITALTSALNCIWFCDLAIVFYSTDASAYRETPFRQIRHLTVIIFKCACGGLNYFYRLAWKCFTSGRPSHITIKLLIMNPSFRTTAMPSLQSFQKPLSPFRVPQIPCLWKQTCYFIKKITHLFISCCSCGLSSSMNCTKRQDKWCHMWIFTKAYTCH